jgi:hypothetical protein
MKLGAENILINIADKEIRISSLFFRCCVLGATSLSSVHRTCKRQRCATRNQHKFGTLQKLQYLGTEGWKWTIVYTMVHGHFCPKEFQPKIIKCFQSKNR